MTTKKNFYEILGVAAHVGSGQIQAAYRFARSLYSGDATPTHGFLDPEERSRMLAQVEEAYAVLANPNTRRDYDARLDIPAPRPTQSTENRPDRGGASRPAPVVAAPSPPLPPPQPKPEPPEAIAHPLKVPELLNGPALKALRESRQLSIDQIAALSKVGSRFLRALEEDRHEALPGRVFARGFLIEYARAIRAPEGEVVERYLRHWTAK